MKIASFNANGIRARHGVIIEWLDREKADILCLQETKVHDNDFPLHAFIDRHYHCVFRGEKGYNGVAMISRVPLEAVRFGFGEGEPPEETRVMSARWGMVTVVNTYVPQGVSPQSDKFRYKMDFFERLRKYFERCFDPSKALVWAGDFNVAPEAIDVYDPEGVRGCVGFHPEEHAALGRIKKWGFVDVFRRHRPEGGEYTFWDYRVPRAVARGLGWRLDHIWATAAAASRSQGAWIDRSARLLPRPSDHTFVVAEFDFGECGGV